MTFGRNGLLTAAFVLTTAVSFSQSYNSNTGSVIWDLGPDDPRVSIQLGTKGINIGGYEDVAPIVKNNFSDTLLVKVQFNITDYCGETKVYTTNSKTLNAWERWAPSPFFEGYGFNTTCKNFGEYGPEKNKTKTRISRISHQILILRNLSTERKEAAAEKARKERELALKRQQEEEAKRKAEEARKAEEQRKLAERQKQEELKKAEEARRKAEAERQQIASQQERATTTTSGYSTSTSGSTSTAAGQPTMQEQLARQAEQQRIAEERRAEEQAAAEAAEREHNRILAEKQLADMRRREEERRAEEQRQKQLEQKRVEYAQKSRLVQESNEEVEELQNLDINHSDIERMEREYAQRLSQLNVAMNNLEQAKQEQWTAAVQSTDWGADQTSQAVGELVQTTGAFVNSLGEEKRRREARENLKYQRQEFLRRIENEKAQMRYDLRMEMLGNFEAWNIPAAPASRPTRVYGFYILHNYPDLAGETTQLTVSNIAEIGTYSDGSWPSQLFFSMVETDGAKNFTSRRFHSNGYTTRAQAEQARQALIQLFSKDGTVSEIHLDANINSPDQRMDFWETGVSSGK